MASISPTQRTLKANKNLGRKCGIVERWQQYGGKFGVRQDLFGFIDIIAIDEFEGIVGIQSTGQDFSGHIKKIMNLERQFLLAISLGFTHPTKNKRMNFKSKLPNDLEDILKSLRNA